MTPAFAEYLKAWLQKAENDLLSAQRLLEIEPIILDTACFHCQQAVEKSMKAFLIYKGTDLIRTHDIDFLLSQCIELDDSFRSVDTRDINQYAVQIRYPDISSQPEKEDAEYYYKLAAEVLKMVKEKVVFTEG